MASGLLDALVRLDNATRVGARVLAPGSAVARELMAAVAQIRREIAARALADLARQPFDPKADLMAIFRAAEAAGLAWPDLAEALNTYHQQNPGA